MSDLSHLDSEGNARMVDVGGKEETERIAVAEAFIHLADRARSALFSGELKKGDALAAARIAAIGGAKRTSDLVPLCHPLALTSIDVGIDPTDTGVRLTCTVRTVGRTGVEMEAITGASIGAITIYDMTKSLDRGAEIGPIRLVAKSGGSSGDWER